MELWQQLLLGAFGLLLIFWFRPGIKATLEQSRQAENKDWKGALIPIGLVLLFVILMIAMVRA
jgi:hypothetical protein